VVSRGPHKDAKQIRGVKKAGQKLVKSWSEGGQKLVKNGAILGVFEGFSPSPDASRRPLPPGEGKTIGRPPACATVG